MQARTILLFLALGLAASVSLYGQETSDLPTLTTAEAKDHIGEKAKVCGRVASTHYVEAVWQQPPRDSTTILCLDKPLAEQGFRVSIPGWDRERFGEPEVKYKDKTICVTGRITSYEGVLNIVAPDQIEVQGEEGSPTAKPKPGETLSLTGKRSTVVVTPEGRTKQVSIRIASHLPQISNLKVRSKNPVNADVTFSVEVFDEAGDIGTNSEVEATIVCAGFVLGTWSAPQKIEKKGSQKSVVYGRIFRQGEVGRGSCDLDVTVADDSGVKSNKLTTQVKF